MSGWYNDPYRDSCPFTPRRDGRGLNYHETLNQFREEGRLPKGYEAHDLPLHIGRGTFLRPDGGVTQSGTVNHAARDRTTAWRAKRAEYAAREAATRRTGKDLEAWNAHVRDLEDRAYQAKQERAAERLAEARRERDADLGAEYADAMAGRLDYGDNPGVLIRFLFALVDMERLRRWLSWNYPVVRHPLTTRATEEQEVMSLVVHGPERHGIMKAFVQMHREGLFDDRLFALLERDLLPGHGRPLRAMLARYAHRDEFAK